MFFFGDQKKKKSRVQRTTRISPRAETHTSLRVDVYEEDNAVTVFAEVPGATLRDITISIEGEQRIVIIEGVRTRPSYEENEKKLRASDLVAEECEWGSFYRRLVLPHPIVIQQATAKLLHGVLILVLPFEQVSERERTAPRQRDQKNETRHI